MSPFEGRSRFFGRGFVLMLCQRSWHCHNRWDEVEEHEIVECAVAGMEIWFAKGSEPETRATRFQENVGRHKLTKYTNSKAISFRILQERELIFTDDGFICFGEAHHLCHGNGPASLELSP